MRDQAIRASAPKEIIRVQTALQEWVRQKDIALSFASNEGMLPARNFPDHNIIDTHVLSVNLDENPKGSGKFDVINVRIAPKKELIDSFKYLGNEKGYLDLVEKLERMRKGSEARGEKIFGTAHSMIRCVHDGHMLMQVRGPPTH